MRAVNPEELNQIAGGLWTKASPKMKTMLVKGPGDGVPNSGTVSVTATVPSSDWNFGNGNYPPSSGGDDPGGDPGDGPGGGGSHSTSPEFGNLNPPTDTLAHRTAIVDQAAQILYDLGYYVPPHTTITYSDKFAFQNVTTGIVRLSVTYNPDPATEKVVYGYTTPGEIVITENSINPHPDGTGAYSDTYVWNILEDSNGNPSMTGINQAIVVDGGVSPLEQTIASLAHEMYHANVNYHDGTNPSHVYNSLNEERADTQGFMAERAFTAAVLSGR